MRRALHENRNINPSLDRQQTRDLTPITLGRYMWDTHNDSALDAHLDVVI
jgi:hypothetical protein